MTEPGWIAWWYRVAAVYGLIVLLPSYLVPPIAGAEVPTYGFVGIAAAFQLVFWVIGSDPVRYRALMPVSVIEKLAFGVPVLLLFAAGRAPALVLLFGAIDLVLGVGFFLAWRRTPRD